MFDENNFKSGTTEHPVFMCVCGISVEFGEILGYVGGPSMSEFDFEMEQGDSGEDGQNVKITDCQKKTNFMPNDKHDGDFPKNNGTTNGGHYIYGIPGHMRHQRPHQWRWRIGVTA